MGCPLVNVSELEAFVDRRLLHMLGVAALTAFTALPALPQAASAQGFLFGPPRGSVSVRGGMTLARAGSDIFDFVRQQLTLERSDFDAPLVAVELALGRDPRIESFFTVAFARSARWSEFRDYVDQDGLPIEQKTALSQLSIAAGGRFYLVRRGRQIGTLAWIPTRAAPYVGMGLGAVRYQFVQEGDFVDYEDLSIFHDRFDSAGWTPTVQVLAGVDFRLASAASLLAEARLAQASARLEDDFVDFDKIDLSGLQATLGVRWRF